MLSRGTISPTNRSPSLILHRGIGSGRNRRGKLVSGGALNLGRQNSSRIRYLSRLVDPFVRRKRSNYQSRSLRVESYSNWVRHSERIWLARPTFMLLRGVGFSLSKIPAVFSTIRRSRTLLRRGRTVPERSMAKASPSLRGPRDAFARVIVRSSQMAFL